MARRHKNFRRSVFFYWAVPGFLALCVFFAFSESVQAADSQTSVVARIRSGASLERALAGFSPAAIERIFYFSSDPGLSRTYRITFGGSRPDLARLAASGAFDYIQKDNKVRSASIFTTDPQFTTDSADTGRQWWLAKTKILDAWESSKGGKGVTVAVVDTGVDGKHEDLSAGQVGGGYLSYCQASGGTGNCLVHISATVAAGENTDDNGHGTIVAGIIGATPDNSKGIAGINWNVRLMPIKVLDSSGSGVSSDVAAGIVWAADNGAQIINLSLGGTSIEGNAVLNQAITYAYNKSVLVVAAAGNDAALIGSDLDIAPVYPVCNDGQNNMVLGVAAVDDGDKKALFSNYGRGCIDISAPGTAYFNTSDDQKGLISTYYDPKQPTKNNLYVFASGTSIAAPIVSGIAALVKAKHPDLSGISLRDRLIASSDSIDGVNIGACHDKSCTGKLGSGRINASKALSTATFISDTLIRDSSGGTFLIESGLRRPISDFVLIQRGFKPEGVKSVSLEEAELLPQGSPVPPLDGSLIMGSSNPTVFYVDRGILQPVSFLTFRSFGFSFDRVKALSENEISGYRLGGDLMPKNGALLKLVGEPAVYFLHEGQRRLLSAFVFRNRGLNFSDVAELDSGEFAKYPADNGVPLEPPGDGALVKGAASSAVYVVEDGRLRALSYRAFVERGYRFADVNILPESELAGYKPGEPIL